MNVTLAVSSQLSESEHSQAKVSYRTSPRSSFSPFTVRVSIASSVSATAITAAVA